ncbi:alpha-1,3/1,6-mannosyltransferase ALG2-like [Symsagittifera roscoffensis]|uniref:alpha-1,3/1,6-mannosyltransferase ALG2-like n=1 Tax=Symsagittifera roscoffensis TaxID=84072 RepID=UPI00307BE153
MVRVAFVHPDLGIGGAERWLVDSALALRSLNHPFVIYTSHYDPSHCFDETKQMQVVCKGDWLPRSLFGGRCAAVCAYLRMIYLAFYIVLFSPFTHDVFICDQISACIPVLRMSRKAKIVFYCHFPDMLLTARKTMLKRIYRAPIDALEQFTTGLADTVLVNSRFTLSVFRDTFPSLQHKAVDVLYPCIHTESFDSLESSNQSDWFDLDPWYNKNDIYLLSLNRFERKKNIALAIDSLAQLRESERLPKDLSDKIHLIIAGGYDSRVAENVDHYEELWNLAHSYNFVADGLSDVENINSGDKVHFLKSPSHIEKLRLLDLASVLLYTPSGEHFGIVPVEAMYMRTPVVAVNSGGPLETILDGVTGYLSEPDPKSFAQSVEKVLLARCGDEAEKGDANKDEEKMISKMGDEGKKRVQHNFSFEAFASKLDHYLTSRIG